MKFVSWLSRRLVAVATQMVIISIAIFGALYVTPGDPDQILLGANPATPEALAAVRAKYHLDDSVVAQYLHWLQGAVRMDFGTSIQTGQPVTAVLGGRGCRSTLSCPADHCGVRCNYSAGGG